MAIHEIFPTNIVIQDIELSEKQTKDLIIAIESLFLHNYGVPRDSAISGENKLTSGNCADPMAVFTAENIKVFTVLKDIKEIFINGFYELSQSYENSNLTREVISNLFENDFGQLPIMKKGQNMPAHTHPGCIASAVFYLTDVDNEKDGGQLVLRDPSWHSTPAFRNSMEYEINTKAGRLVVFPVHVWHEVTSYFGDKDRVTMVANLSYMNSEFVNHVHIEAY